MKNRRTAKRPLIFFLLVFPLFLFMHFPSITFATEFINITASEANLIINTKSQVVVLDVRTIEEYGIGHIKNAKLIPLNELQNRLDELNLTSEILVYSDRDERSINASQYLVDNGFIHVYNIQEGLSEWASTGYPVYKKYTSIQKAINNATEGNTIYVSKGIYYENIMLNKSLTLRGENKETTIIDANYTGNVILVSADDVVISNFSIRRSECSCFGPHGGFYIEKNHENITISYNIITENGDPNAPRRANGIYGGSISNLTITFNSFTKNEMGINLKNSSIVNIYGNMFSSMEFGVYLESSDKNLIVGNNIINNTYGLGVIIAENNLIFYNNFINNSDQTFLVESVNIWDNGIEGNFWSNHTMIDLDRNGICDNPFIIDGDNIDNNALVNLITVFESGVWDSCIYPIIVATNSTISSFNFNPVIGPFLKFTVFGDNETSGLFRISIPKKLLWIENSTWIVFVDTVQVNPQFVEDGNSTYLWFMYNHSAKMIEIHGSEVITELVFIHQVLFFTAYIMIVILFKKWLI